MSKAQERRQQKRRANAFVRALSVLVRRQTKLLRRAAAAAFRSRAALKPSDLRMPQEDRELWRHTITELLLEATRLGRSEARTKIARGLNSAPPEFRQAVIQELAAPNDVGPGPADDQTIESLRRGISQKLQYQQLADQYRAWADQLLDSQIKQTVARAQAVIQKALAEGLPWNDFAWDKALGKAAKPGLRSRLEKVFRDYEDWQIKRVAVTEHNRAVNLGNEIEYRADEKVVGVHAYIMTNNPCPECLAAEGDYALEDPNRPRYPLHPNCDCKIDPVFAWEKPDWAPH